MQKHIFIASPAFGGKVNVQFALSLIELNFKLRENGISVTNNIAKSGSLLVAERNKLVEEFFRSDATHALFIDSDLGFPAQAVIEMLNADKEFIAGVYPARTSTDDVEYLIRPKLDEKDHLIFEKHLLAAEYIPAGFMLISREAIQKMRDKFPELYYEPKAEHRKEEHCYMLFNTEIYDGEFWGEDYVFCRKAREAGIDIWVDPLIEFDHDGKRGVLIEFIKSMAENKQLTFG